MISVEDATARSLALAPQMSAEWISLAEAAGRALAAPIVSRLTHPPFDASAMDGYAVRAADVAQVPKTLKIVGAAQAGGAYAGVVGSGEAVRIFTGAPLPNGADAIVIQENVDAEGDSIVVRESSLAGKHIRRRGYDLAEGGTLVGAGVRLSAVHLALAAAGNVPWISVARRPRVAVLATGDELVRPGEPIGPHQIVSSNTIGIGALARAAGADVIDLGIARDSRDAIADRIEAAQGADVLVTLGGASVGDHDLVQSVLSGLGYALDFWKVAMRPGKPIMLGRRGTQTVFGLPGNPVSAFVGALLFLRPVLLQAQGLDPALPVAFARISKGLAANDKRADFLRGTLAHDGAHTTVTPVPSQDSAMLSALAASHALILRAPHAPAVEAGSEVAIIPLAGLL